MKNLNRARRNDGKKAAGIQSAKSEELSPKPPVVENPDIATLLEQAVQQILKSNKTRHGLAVESISQHLPAFGFTMAPEEVLPVLEKLEQAGTIRHAGGFWRIAPAPGSELTRADLHLLRALLPYDHAEKVAVRAGAVLELLRCKLESDLGNAGYFASPNYDQARTNRVCGILGMINDAQRAIDEAYAASESFNKEFRRLAGLSD